MNVGNEASQSYWMKGAPVLDAPRLAIAEHSDVVVVGAGIAGLSVAYELGRLGRAVIVIDRGGIGNGMTARTTAHLSSALDDFYSELIRVRGEAESRLYHESQVAAINRIETICRDENIDCDFHRLDGYLIPTEEGPIPVLQDEYEACRMLGVAVEWVDRAPVPGLDTGRSLKFPSQGRFHPTRYLAGLARAILARGGRIFADTAYISHEEDRGGVRIQTEGGAVITAKSAVFATNSPVNDKVAIHTKQIPNRTYVIAGAVPKGSVPDILLWDTHEAYHYVRIQELSETQDLLLVGGEDHRSGRATDQDVRIGKLADWTRRRFPSFGGIDHSWSGQVLEPIDFMPFSGRNPGDRNIYIHTGDSGQGITNGVAGSLTIAALIVGEDSRFASVLDPGRKSFGTAASLGEFVSGQANVVKTMAEHFGPGEIGSASELEPGQGGIMREGLFKLAVYKTPEGEIIRRLAVCTHVGCVVHWNGFEKCWDCPCHGSHFAPDGEVLNGPALSALDRVEED